MTLPEVNVGILTWISPLRWCRPRITPSWTWWSRAWITSSLIAKKTFKDIAINSSNIKIPALGIHFQDSLTCCCV